METVYWTMKNGQKIDIDKMDLNHLRNTLKMIVKQSKKPLVRQEFSFNGDMAQEFNNDVDYHGVGIDLF